MSLLPQPGHRPRCAPRRRPVALERLEERELLAGIAFQYTLDDPGHLFAPYPLMPTDLAAVGQILSGLLAGRGTIQVVVRPDNSISRSEGSTLGVVLAGTQGGRSVYESAALAEAQTGIDPNGTGPEIAINLNTQSFLPHVWFDPSGAARTGTVPAGEADFISLALHETLHGLGFQGYRALSGSSYGQLPAGYESNFDALTSFGTGANAGTLFFTGGLASARYGGPVPLTSVGPSGPLAGQNFYHVGNPASHPGADLAGDLMNGMVFAYGTRYTVSPVDLAILADLGWDVPGITPPPPPAPVAPPVPAVVPAPGHAPRRRHPHRPAHHRHLRAARGPRPVRW
jgi:hypothetical protein